MSSSKRYSLVHSKFIKIIIALALIASVSIVIIPYATAALDPLSVEWSKTYDGLQGNSVIQTSDGGYAVAGTAGSPDVATLIKTDSSGNIQWQKPLGKAVSIAEIIDSGYVVFCENGNVIQTDTQGNTLSSFYLGLNGVREGIVTSDRNYIVIGNSIGENGESFAWLRKVNPQGNIVWNMNYTSGYTVSSVVETDDRGCAMAGNWKTQFG